MTSCPISESTYKNGEILYSCKNLEKIDEVSIQVLNKTTTSKHLNLSKNTDPDLAPDPTNSFIYCYFTKLLIHHLTK
jgi:hypothetical protein